MRKQPSKRTIFWLTAFFMISGLLFLAGAAYAWWDEHGGEAGKAHVTDCSSSRISNRTSVHCDATWIYNGRPATGYVENARMNYEGRTIDVRIHGTSHVTVATYWVPIGLALFAVFEFAVGVMVVRSVRRRTETGAPEPDPGLAA